MDQTSKMISRALAATFLVLCSCTVSKAPAPGPRGQVIDYFHYEMITLPPGSFIMGSPDDQQDRRENEGPTHRVRLSRGFAMGRTEIPLDLYQRVVGLDSDLEQDLRSPIVQVSWFDAISFCNELSRLEGLTPAYELFPEVAWNVEADGYRLPTEAEWEYAARAGENQLFSGSDDPDQVAWHKDNAQHKLHRIATREPNAWGFHDMSGNAWEWVWDRQGPYEGDATDPRGPDTGQRRLLRGGSWDFPPRYSRVAYRNAYPPDFHNEGTGFRVARNIEGKSE